MPSTLRAPPIATGIINTLRKLASFCPVNMPGSNSITASSLLEFWSLFSGQQIQGKGSIGTNCWDLIAFYLGKRGRGPKEYTCAQGHFGSSGRGEVGQALTFLGSILLYCTRHCGMEADFFPTCIARSFVLLLLLGYSSSQALAFLLLNSP